MSELETTAVENQPAPKWKPIPALQRRILGVLAEKAKTTPDAYPLSLNALVNGCNQKSNRYPQMNVEPIEVENELEKLRAMGAVSEVQGGGRVARFKHYLYEWLGVSKVESAVMIELLLRGAQTLGDLRGRAARMESIPGVSELKPIIQGLIDRGLVLSLTPEGRGQIVTHALYLEQELEKVKRNLPEGDSEASSGAGSSSGSRDSATSSAASSAASSAIEALQAEVAELREEVAELRASLDEIRQQLG